MPDQTPTDAGASRINDNSVMILQDQLKSSIGALEGVSTETASMMPASNLGSEQPRYLPKSFCWNHNVAKLFVDETAIERKPLALDELKRMCKQQRL